MSDKEHRMYHNRAISSGHRARKHAKKGIVIFGLASLLWLLLRTGTKPSRISYPCQQAALANAAALFPALTALVLGILTKTSRLLNHRGKILGLILLIASSMLVTEAFRGSRELAYAQNPNQEIHLNLSNNTATLFPSSNIFAVNGRQAANVNNLINLMAQNGLDFYSIVEPNDVVLIKINEEWPARGGTDTDILKQLIQAIVAHPQGFTGEVVVADNGQFQGNMNWPQSNAEDPSQSTQDVVDVFKTNYRVSTFDWMTIRNMQVEEYSYGNYANGYVLNGTANAETGIRVSYPKFQTDYGTFISFKKGVWNGTRYEERLKVINLPVLKSHGHYGVTASLKHYMGVQSEGEAAGEGGLANGHNSVAIGGMGTLMAETRMPTLNIICAIWVNAVPQDGPATPFSHATRTNIIAASVDPAALDYWASKHILVQAAQAIGYSDTHTLDPDSTDRTSVIKEAWGIWLPKARDALLRMGIQVTTDPQQMNVYILSADSNLAPTTWSDYNGLWHNSDFSIKLTASASNGIFETYYRINNGSLQNIGLNGQPVISTESNNNTLEYWSVDKTGLEELPHKLLTQIKLDKTPPTGSVRVNNYAANANSATVIVGANVAFDGSGSTDNLGVVSYSWDFGDGTAGTGTHTAHSYIKSGTYTAKLTVADASGNTALSIVTINVRQGDIPELPSAPILMTLMTLFAASIVACKIWSYRKAQNTATKE